MQTTTRTIILKPEELEILKAHLAGKNENRPALQNLIAYDQYLCATDGHALVAIKENYNLLAPGSWKILHVNKDSKVFYEVMLQFMEDQPPDVSYYIDQQGCSGARFEILINKKESCTITRQLLGIFKNTNKAIQFDFIKRLHYPTAWIYRASCTAHDKVLALTNEDPNIQAYILPFKM